MSINFNPNKDKHKLGLLQRPGASNDRDFGTYLAPEQGDPLRSLTILGHVEYNVRLGNLPMSQIRIDKQPAPNDLEIVNELKVSIAQVGQTTPILIRQLTDGTHRLIDGRHRIEAMSEIGRKDCSALILTQLSDEDADILELVSNLHRRKLSPLDEATKYCKFLHYVERKVSQDATPSGGRQPNEKFHQKAAGLLGISADRMARAERIAAIHPDAQTKARELGLHKEQAALLKIAKAGDRVDLQIAKALELHARPKKGPKKPLGMSSGDAVTTGPTTVAGLATGGSGSEMPDIPPFLKRDPREITYDHIKEKWARCEVQELLFAAEPAIRRRFLDEDFMPTLFPALAVMAAAEEVLA
jgi:hypothetical protein